MSNKNYRIVWHIFLKFLVGLRIKQDILVGLFPFIKNVHKVFYILKGLFEKEMLIVYLVYQIRKFCYPVEYKITLVNNSQHKGQNISFNYDVFQKIIFTLALPLKKDFLKRSTKIAEIPPTTFEFISRMDCKYFWDTECEKSLREKCLSII